MKGAQYAVIFSSTLRNPHDQEYFDLAEKMDVLVKKQTGFIGMKSFRNSNGEGVTISYWSSLKAIKDWKSNSEHLGAQQYGKEISYAEYHIEVCKIERSYSLNSTHYG